MKTLALYAAMIIAAFGISHALEKMSRDQDTPITAIVQAQANQPFGYQIPQAQLNAIMRTNTATIASDRAALAQAEQVTP